MRPPSQWWWRAGPSASSTGWFNFLSSPTLSGLYLCACYVCVCVRWGYVCVFTCVVLSLGVCGGREWICMSWVCTSFWLVFLSVCVCGCVCVRVHVFLTYFWSSVCVCVCVYRWVFVHEKAYQVRDTAIESSVMTKVKGFGVYNDKVMDVADYVTPTQVPSCVRACVLHIAIVCWQ